LVIESSQKVAANFLNSAHQICCPRERNRKYKN